MISIPRGMSDEALSNFIDSLRQTQAACRNALAMNDCECASCRSLAVVESKIGAYVNELRHRVGNGSTDEWEYR